MFGKHKAVIKPNADRELLATVARVRESLNRTRELAATFREADPAVTAQIALQGALFDFLYREARVRAVSGDLVAEQAAVNQLRQNR